MIASKPLRWFVSHLLLPLAIPPALVCFCLYYFQEHLIFFPRAVSGYDTPNLNPEGFKDPGEHSIEYEDVYLTTPDAVSIHLWLMKQPKPEQASTILFFQGNAGNMGFRLPNLVQMFNSLHVNVAALSYRGYGYSSGKPSEQGVLTDASTALEYLHKRQDLGKKKLILFGRSLGGAVAINMAVHNRDKVGGLIVENTFWNVYEMSLQIFGFFKVFPSLLRMLLRLGFESGKIVGQVTQPSLFISGTEDTLVPPSHMKWLYDECGSLFKWLLKVHQGTHNDTWQTAPYAYYETILEFLHKLEANEHDTNKKGVQSQKTFDIGQPAKAEAAKDVRELTEVTARAPRFYESVLRQLKRFEPQHA